MARNLAPGRRAPLPASIRDRYFPPGGGKWIREGVGDDGSCFFHSLARILNFCNYDGETARNRIRLGHNLRRLLRSKVTPETWVDFWRRSGVKAKTVPSAADIRKRMKNPTQWADVYMISWIMDHLDLSLYFFDTTNGRVYCGVRNAACGAAADRCDAGLILWLNHAHFEPIGTYPRRGAKPTFKFAGDDPVVDYVDRRYERDGCARLSLRDIT